MLGAALEFVTHLRSAGLRVSTAEVIDATRALGEVGVESREHVRAVLRATLVKRAADLSTFDQLFALYFERGGPSPVSSEWLRDALQDDQLVDFVAERLGDRAPELGALERMLLGMTSPELAALIRATGGLEALRGMGSPLQVGFYSYRLQQQLGFDAAVQRVRGLVGELGLDDTSESRILQATGRRAAELREQVREFVSERFEVENLRYREQLASGSLSRRPLATLSPSEVRRLRVEVERLARILRAKLRRRPQRKPGGHLDVRRILRRALATDGVPMSLRWIERRIHRPRLVVLCDVSDSVRHVSDFMLHFVYTLVDCFDRVDAFAFVAELGAMTQLFRDHDIDRAIELVHQGAAVNVFANSNYGRALEQFKSLHLGKITSRTTVLVIGDGRTNYHPPRASMLGDIRRRARRLLWLTPEGPSAWSFGDSAMNEYQHHCDQVVHAYDLDSLRQLVDELVRG